MDAAELRAKALAARRFEYIEGEWKFTLQTPTRREAMHIAHERGIRMDDEHVATSAAALLSYAIAESCIVGWTNLRERDVLSGGGDAPLPWSVDMVQLWIDAHHQAALRIGQLLLLKSSARAEALEADVKN